jgi:hypothetical protein
VQFVGVSDDGKFHQALEDAIAKARAHFGSARLVLWEVESAFGASSLKEADQMSVVIEADLASDEEGDVDGVVEMEDCSDTAVEGTSYMGSTAVALSTALFGSDERAGSAREFKQYVLGDLQFLSSKPPGKLLVEFKNVEVNVFDNGKVAVFGYYRAPWRPKYHGRAFRLELRTNLSNVAIDTELDISCEKNWTELSWRGNFSAHEYPVVHSARIRRIARKWSKCSG